MTSYDTLRVTMGRKPIVVVDLLLDYCGNTFGVSPCTATGTKCYNTFATCGDKTNFNKQVKVYRLTTETSFLPTGEQIFPCITDIDIAPTKLDWKGISLRANIQITCKDFPYHDRGIDKYWAERSTGGTFFGKLKRRNPYVVNRLIKVRTGYVDDNRMVYTEDRTYFIDSIDGPDANGKVTIKAKDLLKLGDEDKSKAPAVNTGKLAGDLSISDLTNIPIDPVSALFEYPDSGYVRIGDEVIAYTGKSTNGLSGLTRAQFGTAADAHAKDDKVQWCLVYDNARIEDVLYDLLVTYAAVPTEYIEFSDWIDEGQRWFGLWYFTGIISEPKGVNKLLEEIIDTTQIALWWDEVASLIRFKAVRVPLSTDMPDTLTDSANLLAKSVQVIEREQDRVTRVEVYFGLIQAIDDIKKENFRNLAIVVGSNEESDNAYGAVKTREVLTRWIDFDPHGDAVGRAILARYLNTPKEVTFRVDGKDASLRTGDYIDIRTRLTPDLSGADDTKRYIVTERREVEAATHWEYKAQYVGETEHFACVVGSATTPNYSSATSDDKNTYMYVSDDDGLVATGISGNLIM